MQCTHNLNECIIPETFDKVKMFKEFYEGEAGKSLPGISPRRSLFPSLSDIKSSVIFLVLHLLLREEEEETCSIATADVVTIKKPAEKQL